MAIEPRDQPAQPRPHAEVEEAFHHDLAGQRAGQRRVLARGEQREREQRAGDADAEHRAAAAGRRPGSRRRRRCRVWWNVAAATIRIAALMNSANISANGRVDGRVAHRLAHGRRSVRSILARLHDRRVQVEVVRHHRRAEDADGDVEHAPDRGRRRSTARSRRARRPMSGRENSSSATKQTPTVATSVMTIASR